MYKKRAFVPRDVRAFVPLPLSTSESRASSSPLERPPRARVERHLLLAHGTQFAPLVPLVYAPEVKVVAAHEWHLRILRVVLLETRRAAVVVRERRHAHGLHPRAPRFPAVVRAPSQPRTRRGRRPVERLLSSPRLLPVPVPPRESLKRFRREHIRVRTERGSSLAATRPRIVKATTTKSTRVLAPRARRRFGRAPAVFRDGPREDPEPEVVWIVRVGSSRGFGGVRASYASATLALGLGLEDDVG